jgi:rhodanese-related sulfurtransferase
MSSDSESDARKGKEERRKQAASHKKKKVTTEYEDTDDGDDESEDTEERRYRKDAEKRLQETLKRLRQEKRLNQAKDKKEAMVVDIDSDSLSSKEHIPPQVSAHRSNLMVRQNIDDVDSESEGEPSVKPKKQVPKVDTVVVQQDKENIVSRVASRQNDNESLSDKSAVIRYKKREKEREKNNLLMKKLKNDTDDESDRKPKSK